MGSGISVFIAGGITGAVAVFVGSNLFYTLVRLGYC